MKVLWLFAIEANQIIERFLREHMSLQYNESEIVPSGQMLSYLLKVNLSRSIDLERNLASHWIQAQRR